MKLFVANLLVFLGTLLIIPSYYYCSGIYKRYLKYCERNIEKYDGWKRDFNEIFYAIQDTRPSRWAFPFFGSFLAYLLIGFGITASLGLVTSTESATIYMAIIIGVAFPYNFILLMFEKKTETRKSIQVIRLFAVNAVISASLILGAILRKGDIGLLLTGAIIYFVGANLLIILPALRYFEKHKG